MRRISETVRVKVARSLRWQARSAQGSGKHEAREALHRKNGLVRTRRTRRQIADEKERQRLAALRAEAKKRAPKPAAATWTCTFCEVNVRVGHNCPECGSSQPQPRKTALDYMYR